MGQAYSQKKSEKSSESLAGLTEDICILRPTLRKKNKALK